MARSSRSSLRCRSGVHRWSWRSVEAVDFATFLSGLVQHPSPPRTPSATSRPPRPKPPTTRPRSHADRRVETQTERSPENPRRFTRVVEHGRVAYILDPLLIELETPNYGLKRPVQFSCRLSGMNNSWVTTGSAIIRYPFVPPGNHVLTVIGETRECIDRRHPLSS